MSRPAGLQRTGDMSQVSSMGREGPCGEEAQKPLEDPRGRVWVPGLPLPHSPSADPLPQLYLLTKMNQDSCRNVLGVKKKPTSHPGPMTSRTNADTSLPGGTTAPSHEAETPEEVGKAYGGSRSAEALPWNLGVAALHRELECARLQSEFLEHLRGSGDPENSILQTRALKGRQWERVSPRSPAHSPVPNGCHPQL